MVDDLKQQPVLPTPRSNLTVPWTPRNIFPTTKAGGPESDVGTTSARAAESARQTSTTDFRGERDAREEYTSAWAANLAIGAMDMHQPKTGGIG